MSPESPVSAVGFSVPRVDGVGKVRGTAKYVGDLSFPRMYHAATVRSPIPSGILRGFDRDPSFDWSEITVVTADDIPGKNTVLLIEEDQPALVPVGGVIRHVTEPLALVAAPTRGRAFAAAAALRPRIDEQPALLSIDSALRGDVLIHGDDNVFKRFKIEKGDIDAGFAEADEVIVGTYETGAQEQMYIEPQGMISYWDDRGACHILGSMQCPYYIHKAMKPLLGIDGSDIIISQAVTGGGFGGKEEYPSMIAAHAALLAKKAGRPVKLIYDRDEDIAATTKRHPSRVVHKLGIKRDGTITAISVDVIFDGGAYATLSQVVLSRGVLHAAGPYRCKNVRVVGRAVATNHPPHGAFRGFGAPQTTFPYERQMDKAAARIGMDPMALREQNMLRLGDDTATSQRLDASVGSEAVFAKIKQAAMTKPAETSKTSKTSKTNAGPDTQIRRGRGMAFYFHGAGFTGSGEQRLAGRATVAALPAGAGFEIRSSSTDIGQGALTMFSQIAATALGVPLESVRVANASTAIVPDSGPTVASRTCMVVGGLVERASKGVRSQIQHWAEANGKTGTIEELATEMTAAEGEVSETVQYRPPPGIVWDDETYTGSAYPVYGWAACLVDVAVDIDTYEVTVERCVHAVDVGKAIHPIIVKGQIEGGTLQALGWALWESVIYENGRVQNDRMTTSIIPTFADAPEMETFLIEEPYPHGPHGAKGVGEIPMDGPAAAVANAIGNALGIEFDQLPILPEVIEQKIRQSKEMQHDNPQAQNPQARNER